MFTLLLLLLFFVSLTLGSNPLPLLKAAADAVSESPTIISLILTEIRLPRTLIALLAGATLGLCGAVMQGLLRNPLASPGLIGSSSGAAFGAVLVLYLGITDVVQLALPVGGMLGSLAAMLLVYMLAGRDASIITLILAGVAINTLALALVSLILNLAPSPYAVQEIALWMLGSVADKGMHDFWLLLFPTLIGWGLLAGSGKALDALTLGEDTAHTLGFNLPAIRWRLFLALALAVGAAVSITGAIGFVGLVTPHLIRPLVGHQPSRLLTTSALGGAAILLLADILVRLLPPGQEIKVGVITSLVGAPFFLYLILKTRRVQL
ncbi:MAG: iron ABC transporter permease [Gammaproteobacteria bacterium]|nr:iron ABC transporter permease [Gammaproteobacteria bacterium]